MADTPERRTWVDVAVKLAPYVGMNPMRLRWKLENWRRRRTEAARRREQVVDHLRYEHKTCPACGAVQDRDATVCSRCSEPLGRRRGQVLRRLGLLAPEWLSVSSLLGLSFVLVYVRVVAATNSGGLSGFRADALFDLGGNVAEAVRDGEVWRLLTACFLHGGILHLAFNLFGLSAVGPRVEELYGRLTMLFLFALTGVIASLGSGMTGMDGVGIGASGGLMGLVGVAAGWGQREGTSIGRQVRNDMLKWAAYTVIFGLVANADNRAHVFGLLAGFAWGLAIRPATWRRPSLRPARATTGLVGIAAALLALVLIARPPSTHTTGPLGMALRWSNACRVYQAGDTQAAADALTQILRDKEPDREPPLVVQTAEVPPICQSLER